MVFWFASNSVLRFWWMVTVDYDSSLGRAEPGARLTTSHCPTYSTARPTK